MAPHWLFPLLAAFFLSAAVVRGLRVRRADPAVRTWALLAIVFAAIAAWLAPGMTFVH